MCRLQDIRDERYMKLKTSVTIKEVQWFQTVLISSRLETKSQRQRTTIAFFKNFFIFTKFISSCFLSFQLCVNYGCSSDFHLKYGGDSQAHLWHSKFLQLTLGCHLFGINCQSDLRLYIIACIGKCASLLQWHGNSAKRSGVKAEPASAFGNETVRINLF